MGIPDGDDCLIARIILNTNLPESQIFHLAPYLTDAEMQLNQPTGHGRYYYTEPIA